MIRLQRRKPPKPLPNAKRREDCAPAIVFVRDRKAEVHEDAVAVVLRRGAFVAVDGDGCGLAIRGHDVAQILGIDRA